MFLLNFAVSPERFTCVGLSDTHRGKYYEFISTLCIRWLKFGEMNYVFQVTKPVVESLGSSTGESDTRTHAFQINKQITVQLKG